MRAIPLLAAAGLATLLPCGEPVSARERPGDEARLLSTQELAEARGGFVIAGLEISLGADLRTYLGGELAMQTIVSWKDQTQTEERWVSTALTPVTAASLENGLLANGRLTMNVNGQEVFLANDGQTALLQRVDGRLQNIALNTASGIDLRQEADISIAVANYQAFREAIAPAIVMSGLGEALSQTAIGATGR